MFNEARRKLGAEFDRIKREGGPTEAVLKKALEPSAVTQAVRSILCLDGRAQLPCSNDELELFEVVVCLMHSRNRKWLSECQVAYPRENASAEHEHPGAALKSRVAPRKTPHSDEEAQTQVLADKNLVLRNYFMQLLDWCILDDERTRYPDLLKLTNGGGLDAASAGAIQGELLDTSAWGVICIHEHLIRGVEGHLRRLLMGGHSGDEDTRAHQAVRDRSLASLHSSLEASWVPYSDKKAYPEDSLFSRLLVNASLNRYLLEGWAFKKRSKQALAIQLPFLEELEKTVPEGFGGIGLDSHRGEAIAKRLEESLGEAGRGLTPAAKGKIHEQIEALCNSANLPEFLAEAETNMVLHKRADLVQAIMYPLLTWCFLTKGAIVNDDTSVHSPTVQVISGRRPVILAGQHMVSLRRLLSTLMFSYQHLKLSSSHLRQHEAYFAGVRDISQLFMEQRFRQAPLGYWHERLSLMAVDSTRIELSII